MQRITCNACAHTAIHLHQTDYQTVFHACQLAFYNVRCFRCHHRHACIIPGSYTVFQFGKLSKACLKHLLSCHVATSATTAIESHRLVFLQLSLSLLHKPVSFEINKHGTIQMAFGIFSRSAYIKQLYACLGDVLGKLFHRNSPDIF